MRFLRDGRVGVHAAEVLQILADFVVGVAEGHAAGDKLQGPVRGEDAGVGEGGAEAVGVGLEAADEAREDAERRAGRVEANWGCMNLPAWVTGAKSTGAQLSRWINSGT